jgi:hypothetical protein
MTNIRMMPAGNGKTNTAVVNGRTYTCALGATLDVVDFDAYALGDAGWVQVATVGTTAQRPSKPGIQTWYHDTSLARLIIFEGATWRDPATGSAV